jgi:hypothetical protein
MKATAIHLDARCPLRRFLEQWEPRGQSRGRSREASVRVMNGEFGFHLGFNRITGIDRIVRC